MYYQKTMFLTWCKLLSGILFLLILASIQQVQAKASEPMPWRFIHSHLIEGRLSELNLDENSITSPTVFTDQIDTSNQEVIYNNKMQFLFGKGAAYGSGVRLKINSGLWFNENIADNRFQKKLNARLTEMSLSIPSEDEAHRVSIGKQHIIWSQDTSFHPIDILGRNQQPKNDIGVNEYNPFIKEGRMGLRYQYTGDDNALDFVVLDAGGNTLHNSEYQFAVNWAYNIDITEINLLAEKSKGFGFRYGFVISTNLGENLVLYTEFITAKEREIPAISSLGFTENQALLATKYFDNEKDNVYNKGLMSVRSLLKGVQAEISLFYNEHGYNTSDWNAFTHNLQQSHNNFIATSFTDGNHFALLANSTTLMRDFYLRRAYLALRLDTLETFDFGNIELNTIYNMEDYSANVQVEFRKNLTRRLAMKAHILWVDKKSQSEETYSSINSEFKLSLLVNF